MFLDFSVVSLVLVTQIFTISHVIVVDLVKRHMLRGVVNYLRCMTD